MMGSQSLNDVIAQTGSAPEGLSNLTIYSLIGSALVAFWTMVAVLVL